MSWISDAAVDRLRLAAESPDLSATRYRLVRRIGHGGMGVVFLADDGTLGRQVALKVLDLPDPAGDLAVRLLREAHILAALEHPGIVPVHDAGTLPDGRVFYAMKYVEGSRLDEHARALESTPERLRVFQKICDAVAFAHSRRVLHRDLKPQNVMVGPFGEVLVMDWGVAKILRGAAGAAADAPLPALSDETPAADGPARHDEPRRAGTADGVVIGTPGYMSPEQARGEASRLDERTDVYGLGMILQFLLSAREASSATGGRATAAQTTASATSAPAGALTTTASGLPISLPRPLAAVVAKAT
ncbi:MAG TPA: serine/threonine-protein kinase, partial [Candidatus Acidoferrales bacterium]|nr:serine/threonine-protein kinase [Candidatus Acidoferrales bacterium]